MSWNAEWGLTRLVGRWNFEREIAGAGVSGRRSMIGVASFEFVDEKRALYLEAGELVLEHGARVHGEQRYFYDEISGGFAVYFHATGDLFESVCPERVADGGWRGEAEHLCGEDVYRSSYAFRADESFAIEHIVAGPRKDYGIRTVYKRDYDGWK